MEIVDKLSVADMRLKFANWEEGWVDPDDTCRPFAVRELAPDAAEWLAEFGTFSVRDMRHVAGLLNFPFDPSQKAAFYERYLDVIEENPWAALPLEINAAKNRLELSGSRSGKARRHSLKMSKTFPILDKMPVNRLRLSSRAHLVEALPSLLHDEWVDVELALAILFEYATVHFSLMGKSDQAELSSRYVRLLSPNLMDEDDPDFLTDDASEADAQDADVPEDGLESGVEDRNANSGETAGAEAAAEAVSDLERRLGELRALVANLGQDSPEEDFRAVAHLANAAAHIVAVGAFVLPQVPAEVVNRLEALGLGLPEPLPAAAAKRLADAQALATIEDAEALSVRLRAIDAHIAASQAAIIEATTSGRYADLTELGAAASAAQNERGTVDALLEAKLAQLRGWLTYHESIEEPGQEPTGPRSGAAPEVKSAFPRPAWAGTLVVGRTVTPIELPKGTRYRLSPAGTAGEGAEEAASANGAPVAAPVLEDPSEAPTPEISAAAAAAAEAAGQDAPGADDGAVKGAAGAQAEDVADAVFDGSAPLATESAAEAWAEALEDSAQAHGRGVSALEALARIPAAPPAAGAEGVSLLGGGSPAAREDATDRLDDHLKSRQVTVALFERNLIGIAADMAGAAEAVGREWPVSADVLKAVAAARAPQREYTQDTQRFTGLVERAMTFALDDLDAVILLGGLLRPAILQHQPTFRAHIASLARGRLGQHLLEAADAIAELGYDFPPSADELARLAGASEAPQKGRLIEKLGVWCDATIGRTSRWQFASVFMHRVASDEGLIGAARRAIEAGRPDAVHLAKLAIESLNGAARIIARSEEFAAEIQRQGDHLYPKGVEYLDRHFSEALGYLSEWIRASDPGRHGTGRSETKLRDIVGNLGSRLEKAARQLRNEARGERPDAEQLECVVAGWLVDRCEEARAALAGGDAGAVGVLEAALTGERDLLPTAIRRLADTPALLAAPLFDRLCANGAPLPAEAYAVARQEGAFEVATRLADRYGASATLISPTPLADEVRQFAGHWLRGVEERQRRLKALAKVDYSHQAEIGRLLRWCEASVTRLAVIEGTELDLSDIPADAQALDAVVNDIEASIRRDQEARLREHRNEENAEEADALLLAIGTISAQAVEDRIAQLRDGRSAAIFLSDAGNLVAAFTPQFLTAAAAPGWPRSIEQYRVAFATADGPLFTEEDRRAAAAELVEAYLVLTSGLGDSRGNGVRARNFLELIGFDPVQVGSFERVAGARAWKARVSAKIVSDRWFLPPIFGSKASSGYDLLLVGPDVLSESVQASLDGSTPSIVVLAGTADFARRREYAERLRATGIPALLIDETLVAYAATRRDTRARTIFECGLPYGRVEPYTTDAGQIPPEMFFGRKAEIDEIMSRTADGCLVYGGRQLGKSALLNHVAKVHHAPEACRIVVRRDVKPLGSGAEPTSAIWSTIAKMLSPFDVVREESRSADDVSADIRGWIALNPHGQIVCMFDETDHFMAAETKSDYGELTRLKELMEDTGRTFKVVFAGLHNVQRTYVQPNSPLAHLGRPICIGPLNRTQDDKRAAHDLVIAPMHAAGFRFEGSDPVDEILAWANYYPSLLQEFLKGLLAAMHGVGSGKTYKLGGEGPLWTIPSSDIFGHRGFQQIETRVRDKFHLTLELDPRYALVANTLAWLNADGDEQGALVTGYEADILLQHCQTFWPKNAEVPSRAAFGALLEEMFDLGVLGRVRIENTKRFRYCLASRQVAAMLGSEDDVIRTLGELEERDPSLAYGRAIYRRQYVPNQGRDLQMHDPYVPLSDLQIEQLLGPDPDGGPAVRIVCGLEILGLGKVGAALRRLSETGLKLPGAPADRQLKVMQVSGSKELREAVTSAPLGAHWLRVLVFSPVNSQEAGRAISWLEKHHKVLNGLVRPIVLLDAADARQRELATRRFDECIWLAAWGAEMLRTHFHNVEKPDLDTPPRRAAILKATGGIPAETISLIKEIMLSDDPDGVIARWKPSVGKIAEATSADLDGSIWNVLGAIEDMPAPDDYQAMDDLIRESFGVDLVTVGPDLVAMGLIAGWNHVAHRIRRSALGNLIVAQAVA